MQCSATSLWAPQIFRSLFIAVRKQLFFFHLHYSPLWALVCRTISFHFFYPSPTFSMFSLQTFEDLFLLPPSILSWVFPFISSLPVLGSWVKIFLGILSSSILFTWPNQLILCPFIHFTIFSPLLISSSSRFVLRIHFPFSYLAPHILLNISLSKISTACSSFFVNVHASAPHRTTGLISVFNCNYSIKSCVILYNYIYSIG